MNDHQDSDNFGYNKSWKQIEDLLNEAEREQNKYLVALQTCPRPLRIQNMKSYKGLEGVINALRWVLGDLKVTDNKVLGRDKR
tara:strand:+ start:3715 stop:3963 length:249 start_codon:yes stop_codon:yes gene_type:complete